MQSQPTRPPNPADKRGIVRSAAVACAVMALVACDLKRDVEVEKTRTAVAPSPSPADARRTPTPTAVGPGERLVDQFVTCDPGFETAIRTRWYTFDDKDRIGEKACNHGSSDSTLTLLYDGYLGSPCSIRWEARLNIGAKFPFAGIGVGLAGVELTPYPTVVVAVRGDGQPVRAHFPMREQYERAVEGDCGNRNWNFYGSTFACGNGTTQWVETKIDLRRLTQEEGWKGSEPFDPSQVFAIHFQRFGGIGERLQCDIGLVKLSPLTVQQVEAARLETRKVAPEPPRSN